MRHPHEVAIFVVRSLPQPLGDIESTQPAVSWSCPPLPLGPCPGSLGPFVARFCPSLHYMYTLHAHPTVLFDASAPACAASSLPACLDRL